MIIDPTFFDNELLGYVIKRVRDRSLAEDLVHDVFLKVQSKSCQVRDDEKTIGWIYRMTANAIIDHFRSQSKVIDAADLDWSDDGQDLNRCVERCVTEKLATLPEKYREAIELSDLKGLSQLDLAAQLKISYSGAKSRVQRGRQMLKDKLEKDYHVEFDNYGNVIRCDNRTPCNCP
jgi:RNA polymerase sigma-70 factor (ECF subfamily)